MRFEHREAWDGGAVSIGLRTRADVNDGVFEVPEEFVKDADLLQRLVDAGHKPLEPSELPEEVEYDGTGGDAAEAEEVDSEEDGDPVAGDEGGGEPPDPEPDDDLADASRSDLWELAHSEEFEEEPPFSWNDSTAEKIRDWIRERRGDE